MGTLLPPLMRTPGALGALTLALLTVAVPASPSPAWSEEPRVGVVAMLLGTATVTRAALPAPALLRFKDDVFLRDRIVTGQRSAVRVLLGGQATVTARERSSLTITEVPAMSTVSLAAGRTAVTQAAKAAAITDVTQLLTGSGSTTAVIGGTVSGATTPTDGSIPTIPTGPTTLTDPTTLTGGSIPTIPTSPTIPTGPTTLTD